MISLLWWSVYVLVLAAAVPSIAAQNVQLSAFKVPSSSSSSSSAAAPIKSTASCGGMLTATHGVIQTPNFPNKFPVPIQCTWIIDASAINKRNVSIIVYFTQQFVLSGLKFTQYAYYSDDIKVKSDHAPFEINEQTVTQVPWVRFNSQILEIKFTMDNLYGTHLRALDRLLDVYGFNITYEMDGIVKPYQCNVLLCRYLGHCYATENFSSYYCSCFPGFNGSDCGVGPLCRDGDKDFCENGGTCKQIGDAGVTCLCPKGFKGKKCQIPEDEDMNGCYSNESDCDSLCHFNGPEQNFCKCTKSTSISNRERARYEAIVHLGNASQSSNDERRRMIESSVNGLKKNVNRSLQNSNVTRINDLEVTSVDTTNMAIKIQFFGAKQDAIRVQEAIQKVIDRVRVSSIVLVPSSLTFREEAVLQIESVSINHKTAVRHNDEFILSCVAKGSAKMIFRWYKNGVYVNQTKATRKIWSRVYGNPQIKDHYTALLGIPKASRLDAGTYTCQVSDYGMQQCRSIVVNVSAKPELLLDPPSATVYRGDSVRVRCLSSDIDQNGYSWTKNNALFQSDAETELWEDLYPDGSILKINNIQKSADYTCVSSNAVGPVSRSVYVYVVDRGTIELCANETLFGVNWPASSPGSPILAECPKRYEGQSQRICELKDFGKPTWLTPNFSGCLADTLVDVYNEFRGLTFGYQKTNGSAVLKSCLEYAMSRHTHFLPGEAGFLLKLLQEVDEYLTDRGSEVEQEVAADITLQILDVVLKSEHSLNNQQQVEDLQELVKWATLKRELITSPVPVPAPSTSLHYHQTGSFWTHKQHIKSLPFSSQVYGDHLFSDQLYMEMALTPQLQEIVTNGSMVLSVISYKNLTNFLPRMYFERNTHTPDIDYMTASRVIASWLVYANRTLTEAVVPTSQLLHLPLTAAHVEIVFQHENPPDSDWIPVCGYDVQASYKATWNTELCITKKTLVPNVTHCICPLSGTYVVLMSKRNYNSTTVQSQQHPMFVVISCGCCFLQSCIAFCILLPILYSRKCSVTFLKMQFCTATSTAMAIFTLGFLKFLPQDWHGIISSSLGGILLLGSSTLIAITVIIDSELGPRKSPTAHLSGGMRGAIGLSWFMPILYAITTLLIYTVMGGWPSNWWITVNTFGFALFVIIETLFVILFSLLFYTLVHKLSYLAKKHDKHGILITKRIGLVYRITCLLVLKISTDTLYLIYSNSNENLFSYIFGALSICLGFTLLVCFVIKAETKLKSDALNKSNSKQIIEDYCSGSINSPLNFYTNHEIEKENDCAVPSSQSSTKKLPLAITTRRYPLDRLQTTSNISDPYITTGGLCETTFLELNDPSANLDVNFIEFKQHPNPQQQQLPHLQQQQSVQQLPTLSKQPSQYPSLLNANGYEMEIMPTDLSLYSSSCKPSQGKCYLSETNDFVGVGSLDILQGVRQDSVIGIRSNYGMSDQMVNPDSNLSALVPSTSNVTTNDGLHSHVNQNQLLYDKNQQKSPQKILESVNVHAVDTQATGPTATQLMTVAPPTITVTPTDETDKTIDGMLDRISHDLDYLLNRMAEIPPAPPPPTSTAPPSLHPTNLSVHEVILEEEAEDL